LSAPAAGLIGGPPMNPSSTQRRVQRDPIRPERVRRIGPDGFAFVPNRFLREGFFATLSPAERELYFLLLLAADRNGLSFYHYDSICAVLQMELETYLQARNALITRDLISYDGTRFQVLSLPERLGPGPTQELRTAEDFAEHDRATIRTMLRRSFPRGDTDPADRAP
jgi:hypothetical protein